MGGFSAPGGAENPPRGEKNPPGGEISGGCGGYRTTFVSRLGELLNTLENVHFFPPRGKKCPPGTPPKNPRFPVFRGGGGPPEKPGILGDFGPRRRALHPGRGRAVLHHLLAQGAELLPTGSAALSKLSGIWALRYQVIGDLGAALSSYRGSGRCAIAIPASHRRQSASMTRVDRSPTDIICSPVGSSWQTTKRDSSNTVTASLS